MPILKFQAVAETFPPRVIPPVVDEQCPRAVVAKRLRPIDVETPFQVVAAAPAAVRDGWEIQNNPQRRTRPERRIGEETPIRIATQLPSPTQAWEVGDRLPAIRNPRRQREDAELFFSARLPSGWDVQDRIRRLTPPLRASEESLPGQSLQPQASPLGWPIQDRIISMFMPRLNSNDCTVAVINTGGGGSPPATPSLTITDNGDGTGAVAAITGSSAGSTNTVYTAPFPAPGTQAVWTASATITGDGSVTLSLSNGCYLAYCESSLGGLPSLPSDTVSFQTTGGSTYESVHYALLESVATKIQGMLGTSIIGPVVDSVRVRKVPFNGDFSSVSPLPSDKKHALPAILVCPFDLEAFNALGGTNARDEIGYPVAVVFIQQNNNPNDVAAETGTDPFLRWREAIERTYTHLRGVTSNAGLKGYLNVTANGVGYTFHNCTAKPGSIFDWNRWQPSGQNLDFGWLLLNFIIWRPGGA